MRAVTQAKCPDAIFTGMCSHDQLATLYASADLLLFPSLTETFGNVTLEALSCGTPVLAFDCAAASDFVHDEKNGWLVTGSDSQAYLARALDITGHPNALKQARAFARLSVAHLGWDAIASEVETIFQRAIALGE